MANPPAKRKGFFARLLEKLDKKMEVKAQQQKSCCGSSPKDPQKPSCC